MCIYARLITNRDTYGSALNETNFQAALMVPLIVPLIWLYPLEVYVVFQVPSSCLVDTIVTVVIPSPAVPIGLLLPL